MFSELRPHFEKIERYYYEINVSLRVEEESLRKIYSSLRVTPGDRLRWENIRDACGAASKLLTPGVGSTSPPVTVSSCLQLVYQTQPLPNIMPQQTVSTSVIRFCRFMKYWPFFPFVAEQQGCSLYQSARANCHRCTPKARADSPGHRRSPEIQSLAAPRRV